ncbi:hypothetical protein F1880_008306 [Penicillium rolfsii]|nr:hypothetical protein F1880_008306 [Penicillium rolfsii]
MVLDPKQNNDAGEARLKALQMADLGTARRELISTADDTRHRIVEMDEIERHRQSNIAGTAEQRRAQENQAVLSAWTNFYRTADTGRVEQLDDLMHGQSHRAQLNAALHGNETAKRPAGGHTRARSFSHVPTHHHHHPYAHSSSGHGGGVIGTRSRHRGTPVRRIATHVGTYFQASDGPARQDPALDSNNPNDPASRPTRGRGHRRHHSRDSHVAHRARLPEVKPKRPAPASTENYARRLTNPADFMANARVSISLPAVSSGAPSSLPPKHSTATKAMTPKTAMAPKPATTPKPGMSVKPAMANKHVTTPKTVQKSSLDDSKFAIPTSTTPAVSAAGNDPGSPTPSRRVVPHQKTAGSSSQAKSALPKPIDAPNLIDEPKSPDEPQSIDERQKESESERPAAVLVDIDHDEEANAETETQIRKLFLSPGMEELTGINFPTENEPTLLSSDDVQDYIAKQILGLISNCSSYIQERLQAAHPLDPLLGPLKATSLAVIDGIARKMVDEWTQKQLRAFEPPGEEATPGPSTPTPGRGQLFDLTKTETMAPELETNQPGKTSIFDNYRTPPRSASATVTDSSDEKKRRNIDTASLLSPKKRFVSSDLPAIGFESLRVSEGENIRTASDNPLSLMEMDVNSTPSKQVIAETSSKPVIFGSLETSMFAAPANAPYQHNKAKASTTFEENITTSKASKGGPVSQAIVRGEGPSRAVSEPQRPALIPMSSSICKETSVKDASGPSAPQAPREMKSRVLSGGIEQSMWADPGPSRFAPTSSQSEFQRRSRTDMMPSRHFSTQSPSTEDSAKPKITFLGPAPYMPKRK